MSTLSIIIAIAMILTIILAVTFKWGSFYYSLYSDLTQTLDKHYKATVVTFPDYTKTELTTREAVNTLTTFIKQNPQAYSGYILFQAYGLHTSTTIVLFPKEDSNSPAVQ